MRLVRPRDKNYARVLRSLDRRAIPDPTVEKTVRAIIAAVQKDGDAALLRLTKKFGGPKLSPAQLQVPSRHLSAAWRDLDAPTRRALQAAHRNIRAFAAKSLRRGWSTRNAQGARTGERFDPFRRVGIYVPGGTAPLVSTALMTCTYAAAAGVKEIVAVTPAGPDGQVSPALLAALHLAGATEVYGVGGAQAVAALALGTKSIAPVDKIFGPGNRYVVEAKRQLFGRVAIDLLPGPSEILVIADRTANPAWVAADLLAQAEHDPLAAAILLTTSEELAAALPAALEAQLADHPRAEITRQAIQDWGLVVVCDSLATAAELSDRFAPEHLELLVEDPEPLAERIRHAGAIFLGPDSPEAVGDYLAGPNHTLPTSGTARFAGALSVETFLRHTSLIRFNPAALAATGPAVVTLAESEGLHSHAESVRRRLAPGAAAASGD